MTRLAFVILLLFPALFLAGCLQGPQTPPPNFAENATPPVPPANANIFSQGIVLNTSDGFNLSAVWLVPLSVSPRANVILLHGAGGSKKDFSAFASTLVAHNYSVLLLDLRGHGESLQYQTRPFLVYGDQEYRNMVYDVQAAYDFLNSRSPLNRTFIIGASLGANLALFFSGQVESVSGTGLLSPGINYRGVAVDQLAHQYGRRPLFASASKEDGYSYDSTQNLVAYAQASGANATLMLYDGAGHGTQMLSGTDLSDQLVRWLDTNVPAIASQK